MTLLLEPSTTSANAPRATGLPVPRYARRRTIAEWAGMGVASVCNSFCGPREKHAFGILMYHRVVDPVPGKPRPTWNVPPWLFERQLSGLLRRGWQPWPLKQLLTCLERELPIPRKTFVVTFDDGFVNNLTQAHPILTRLSVPATLFLATAYLDSKVPFPSDDWSVAGQPGVPKEAWRPLTTEECRRLIGNGLVELGAHTHTHADFRGRPEELAKDLATNLAVLRERFGIERPAMAFPYGSIREGFASAELASVARDAGVVCALNTEPRLVRPGDSPYSWGRFAAEEHDSARSLAAKLGGWQEAIRRMAGRSATGF
jgi:peptidoglycan/xylan/chitin deacetylase (PgdA/CDA1 family)